MTRGRNWRARGLPSRLGGVLSTRPKPSTRRRLIFRHLPCSPSIFGPQRLSSIDAIELQFEYPSKNKAAVKYDYLPSQFNSNRSNL